MTLQSDSETFSKSHAALVASLQRRVKASTTLNRQQPFVRSYHVIFESPGIGCSLLQVLVAYPVRITTDRCDLGE
jgi:hypothetical protein